MRYRKLGETGFVVSEIGFGAWGIGGTVGGSIAYGATDDTKSSRALRLAFDLGVTFYDTSDFYGLGHSESLIGKTLKEVRSKIIIATKVGLLRDGQSQDFSPQHIRDSIEKSLRRLQTDYVDLYQLHNPPLDLLEKDGSIIKTLHSLVQEGKVRAIGISLRSPSDGLIAIEKFGFKAIQVNFNLVDQRALVNGLLDLCEKKKVGVIVRTPLCFGFLTGKYSSEAQFDSQDHRSTWSPEQVKKWTEGCFLFISSLTKKDQQTDAQMALRFCLSFPQVSTSIPGMLSGEHVRENTKASQLASFSKEELQKIEKIYQEHTFFVKKAS